jgi:hypothetical protein
MAIEMSEWNKVFKRNYSNRRKDARFSSHHCGSLSLSHNDTSLLLLTTFSPVLQQAELLQDTNQRRCAATD